MNLDAALVNEVDKAENQSVPVGTVIAWPYETLPGDGEWLECNGETVNIKIYPEFVAKFGSKLPDYRGYFLRGVGGNSAELGAHQGFAVPNTLGKGDIKAAGLFSGAHDLSTLATGDFKRTWAGGYTMGTNGGHAWSFGASFDAAGSAPTAVENRPVNKAVRYLIRVR